MLIKIHPFIWLKFVKLTPFTQEKKIDTVNQLLFACDKFLQGEREPHPCDYFSLQVSPFLMVFVTTWV